MFTVEEIDQDVEIMELSCTSFINVKWCNPFGKILAKMPENVKHTHTIQSSLLTPRYLHKDVKVYVYDKVCNSLKLKAVQMSMHR